MKETKVITEFESLQSAIESKKAETIQMVWKDKGGREVLLTDMSKEELQKVYNHATDMLYNTNKYTPGRFQVKKNIRTLIANCNAELFLRYITHECNIDALRTNLQIVEFANQNKATNNLSDNDSVTTLFTSVPSEFESVTIGQLINACFDKLDIINRKMISDKFILSQGIWLTEREKEELTEYDSNGKIRPWLDVIKERLLLNNVKLRVDPKGFSYLEFRALVHLEPLPKISRLPSDTLRLLRDKVFILLDADTDYHIQKWINIKEQIENVAKSKEIVLTLKEYK